MFVEEVISSPLYIKGKKFVDKTIKSKFNKSTVSITTTYVDSKPLIKQYVVRTKDKLKHYIKCIRNLIVSNNEKSI